MRASMEIALPPSYCRFNYLEQIEKERINEILLSFWIDFLRLVDLAFFVHGSNALPQVAKNKVLHFFAPYLDGSFSRLRMIVAAADACILPDAAPVNSLGTVDASTPSSSTSAENSVSHTAQSATVTACFTTRAVPERGEYPKSSYCIGNGCERLF